MLLLKIIRGCREQLPFVVMAILICQGVLALASMFIMPPISLLMVFVGLATLGVAAVARIMLDACDSVLSRWLGVPAATIPE
jgi:hypothetical protein